MTMKETEAVGRMETAQEEISVLERGSQNWFESGEAWNKRVEESREAHKRLMASKKKSGPVSSSSSGKVGVGSKYVPSGLPASTGWATVGKPRIGSGSAPAAKPKVGGGGAFAAMMDSDSD